jgi:hypothetical protein
MAKTYDFRGKLESASMNVVCGKRASAMQQPLVTNIRYIGMKTFLNLMRSAPRSDRRIMAVAFSVSIMLMLLGATLELVGL